MTQTTSLGGAWQIGLGALRAEDKPHIRPEDARKLTGSADLDAALRGQHPNANRWDFAIAYRHVNPSSEWVYFVEIHTANDHEIQVVLNKLRWLCDWLAHDGHLLNQFKRDFVWVSSGTTAFTLDAPQRKRFAQQGLLYRGKVLHIRNVRPA